MSYQLFNQGYTAEEVKKNKLKEDQQKHATEEFKRWAESEHVLNILRTTKAWHEKLTEMELKLWRKATGQKSLPHPI